MNPALVIGLCAALLAASPAAKAPQAPADGFARIPTSKEKAGGAPAEAKQAEPEPPPTPDETYARIRRQGAARAPGSRSLVETQGAEDAVAELVQVVGQIVADRASAAALGAVKARLQELLRCAESDGQFPQTCAVVAPLRIEDLAASPEALRAALLLDVAGILGELQGGDTGRELVALAVAKAAEAAVRRSDASAGALARLTAQAVLRTGLQNMEVQYAAARSKGEASPALFVHLRPRERAVTLAALAVSRCQLAAGAPGGYAPCSVLDELDAMARQQGCTGRLDAAHAMALGLGEAIAGDTAARRWNGALDAVFTAAALRDADAGEAPQANPCDPSDLPVPEAQRRSLDERARRLRLLHQALVALSGRDTSALVATASQALQLATPEAARQRRGLLLVAATLQYSETFVVKGADGQAARQERVKILKAVADELGNREGREGDTIWSFGGSLRLLAGGRFARGGGAFLGPVSLPLGLALDRPGKRSGLHLEATVVDLGQYLSFDSGVKVQQPRLEQALAPELAVGWGWGLRTPAFLALHLGYTPHYQATPGARRGSFDLGLTFGVFVPIVDLN